MGAGFYVGRGAHIVDKEFKVSISFRAVPGVV
jgi:hypothetical protein